MYSGCSLLGLLAVCMNQINRREAVPYGMGGQSAEVILDVTGNVQTQTG